MAQELYGSSVRIYYRAKISIAFVIKIYYGISIAVTNRSLDRSLFIRLISVDLIQSLDLLRSGESRPGGRSYRVRWSEDFCRARYSLSRSVAPSIRSNEVGFRCALPNLQEGGETPPLLVGGAHPTTPEWGWRTGSEDFRGID